MKARTRPCKVGLFWCMGAISQMPFIWDTADHELGFNGWKSCILTTRLWTLLLSIF